MRKHGFERGFIDCRTLKEQGIERRPEVHLGFEAAGRLYDAQRHDIMQKRSNRTIPAILNRRERSGMTSGNGWDIPVKQHENLSEGCNMMLRGSMALT
ncbi:hypothetical protein ACLB1N_36825 [Escherichia coli]